MPDCTATLGDSEGLACLRTDEHATGHIYASSTGSWVDDHTHADKGHG